MGLRRIFDLVLGLIAVAGRRVVLFCGRSLSPVYRHHGQMMSTSAIACLRQLESDTAAVGLDECIQTGRYALWSLEELFIASLNFPIALLVRLSHCRVYSGNSEGTGMQCLDRSLSDLGRSTATDPRQRLHNLGRELSG